MMKTNKQIMGTVAEEYRMTDCHSCKATGAIWLSLFVWRIKRPGFRVQPRRLSSSLMRWHSNGALLFYLFLCTYRTEQKLNKSSKQHRLPLKSTYPAERRSCDKRRAFHESALSRAANKGTGTDRRG